MSELSKAVDYGGKAINGGRELTPPFEFICFRLATQRLNDFEFFDTKLNGPQ